MSVGEDTARTRELVLERIRADTRFVLASHEKPDGDALGSMVAMHGLLRALGKESAMFISPSDLPLADEYRLFAFDELIREAPPDIISRTVVFLDCGNVDRNPAGVLRDGAHLLNIDHHHDNTRFGTLNHVVPEASCTAEIVWDLMHGLDVPPSAKVAEALYVGLITDTGRFMPYENTTPRARDGGRADRGRRRRPRRLPAPVRGHAGRSPGAARARARAHPALRRGRARARRPERRGLRLRGRPGKRLEGSSTSLRALRGTKVAVLVREVLRGERAGQRKVSLRATDGEVDVSVIARAQGGGGHTRAAGFSTTLEIEPLVAFLRTEIEAQRRSVSGEPSAARVA